MALIEFVRNHEDLSTDHGYQFKFYCDKCGGGWLSEFQTSLTGMGGSLLKAAGGLFGGVFSRAAGSEYEIRRAIGGPAHDAAMKKAVAEAKGRFQKCSKCGKWVCPETCWNKSKGLCEDCAPDLHEAAASAQAQAAAEQINAKARAADQTEGLDASKGLTLRCTQCDAQIQGGKFCPECGAPVSTKTQCKQCGAEGKAGAKFCPECGAKML
ncbi:MAG: zinc ribbon domain-containing protein [Planctomycetes bacterium]|nr:zinc ribbon domain-containing protein [Planctomycetota bacterium]